jgi:hypothetical protein
VLVPYARRRKRPAHTRPRNCSGVSVGRVGAGFGLTTAAAPASAAFLAALRAASCASCLVAKAFASASTVSAGEPSSRRDLCVGHGKAQLGSRPPTFSTW